MTETEFIEFLVLIWILKTINLLSEIINMAASKKILRCEQGRCKTCPYMIESNSFSSNVTKWSLQLSDNPY